ncbi:MAG: hypothetical protein WCF85_21325 [Rhodospirillaceae bacterium]
MSRNAQGNRVNGRTWNWHRQNSACVESAGEKVGHGSGAVVALRAA